MSEQKYSSIKSREFIQSVERRLTISFSTFNNGRREISEKK